MKFIKISGFICAALASLTLNTTKVEGLLAGVKTTGMAATSVAYPIDAFGGVYNPGNITFLCDRMDVGVSWVHTKQGAKIRDLPDYSGTALAPLLAIMPNPVDLNDHRNGAKTADTYVPEFGIVKKFNFGLTCSGCPLELSTSFVLYNRNDLKTTYGSAFALFGCTPTGLEYIHETAALIFATRLLNHHSIGIAINYNVQRLKIDGLEKFACPDFSESPTHTTDRGYNYSNGAGVVLGYLFDWNCLKIGGSWQPKTSMRKFDKYDGFVADHGNFDLPERFTAGISYKFQCRLAVAFDFEFIRWKDIPQLANPLFPNLELYPLGSKNGAGFGFNNQKFYRLGVEYELNNCFTVRAGFRHSKSPINRKYTAINILTLDAMENVFTFGGTWRLNGCHEVSFFCAIGFENTIKGRDSIPLFVPQPIPSGPECGSECVGRVEVPINADPARSTLANFPLGLVKGNGNVDLYQRRSALGIAYAWLF